MMIAFGAATPGELPGEQLDLKFHICATET